MTRNQMEIELLQAEVDENDQSFFRLLVNGRNIKYVTIDPGLYSADDMCFGPSLVSLLPALPAGDWNDGLVTKNESNGQPHFAYAIRTAFPGVENTWNETYVDYSEIVVGEKLRTGIYEVKCNLFNDVVVVKFARFDWEIPYLESETTAYQWIEGYGIGPQFLGHLTEDGRVIGFLMERIKDARHAGPQDLESCRKALSRLHCLGIRHGDTNRFNFLIRDSQVVLIDFDSARKCDDQDALLKELEHLPNSLEDLSRRGGGGLL
jgi:predicted Ser/Thr protein kinase